MRKPSQAANALGNVKWEMYRIFVPNIGYLGTETRESLKYESNWRHQRLRPFNILIGGDARARSQPRTEPTSPGPCGVHVLTSPGPCVTLSGRAEREWTRLYNDSKKCFHAQPCHRKGGQCTVNSRLLTEAVIAGAILPLWNVLDEFTWTGQERDKFMRVTRVKLADGTRIVGVVVPYYKLNNWRGWLQKAGVPIDADALMTINLIEQDAADAEQRGKADKMKAKSE